MYSSVLKAGSANQMRGIIMVVYNPNYLFPVLVDLDSSRGIFFGKILEN